MNGSGKIFVIGDSHIGLGEGAERPVNAWLDRLAALQPKALYLNGDLFHYLIAHDKFRTDSVTRVMAKFRELRDRGIGVHYVEGNRDFFLRNSFVEDAVTDVAFEYAVPAGTKKFLIIHGDMINDRDWKYFFWRRASKNPVTKLGVSMIPRRIARNLVDSVERKLARSNFKHKTRIPVELMEAYGRKRYREGFTDVVFGHFHSKIVMPGRATVTVLPPWYESGEALVIDPRTGDAEFAVVQVGVRERQLALSSGGTQGGQWKAVVSRDCSTGEELVEWYAWQWQASSWSYIGDTGPDPNYCYC